MRFSRFHRRREKPNGFFVSGKIRMSIPFSLLKTEAIEKGGSYHKRYHEEEARAQLLAEAASTVWNMRGYHRSRRFLHGFLPVTVRY